MEPWRTILVLATVIGALVTIGGLVAAYVSAGREYRLAEFRIHKMEELGKAERADAEARNQRREIEMRGMRGDDIAAFNEREAAHQDLENARWDAEYQRFDLVRPTYSNMVQLAAYESRRLLGMVLTSTRRDFLIAAAGLVVSTAASAGSLFMV